MTANEKKFLDELTKLLASYSIEEVTSEERDGAKYIVIYSNGRYLAFQLFKDGTYYDILSQIPEYETQWGGAYNGND